MATKPKGGEGPDKKTLIAGLLCVFIGISWLAYECLRPLTEDELKKLKDEEKAQAEIDRANKKK